MQCHRPPRLRRSRRHRHRHLPSRFREIKRIRRTRLLSPYAPLLPPTNQNPSTNEENIRRAKENVICMIALGEDDFDAI